MLEANPFGFKFVIAKHLRHLDVGDRIKSREVRAIGFGASCDVFRGVCQVEAHKDKPVAMKKLRMHLKGDMKKVRSVQSLPKTIVLSLRSFLSKRYTCGPSSIMRISCHFLVSLSTVTLAIPFWCRSGWKVGMHFLMSSRGLCRRVRSFGW